MFFLRNWRLRGKGGVFQFVKRMHTLVAIFTQKVRLEFGEILSRA